MSKPLSKNLGIFICHCGHNISSKVNIEEVSEVARKWDGIKSVTDFTYLCSQPGQKLIQNTIIDAGLDAVVIASCSPLLHQKTFQRTLYRAGLNPHKLEIANIREQCSWIHPDKKQATQKACRIIQVAASKSKSNVPLEGIPLPVTPAALVIGAGIAGIQAALDIADGGYPVILVEREASIGGNMARLSETFPTLDCAQCTLTPKMVEVAQHPDTRLLTRTEVDSVEGYIGNFKVRLKKFAKYVDWDKCTGCRACIEKCTSKKNSSDFDLGLSTRTAIYTSFPQAVPNKPVIDPDSCRWFGPLTKKGTHRCGLCASLCAAGAIKFDDRDIFEEVEVGAVVVATGFELYDKKVLPEYAGEHKDVISGLQFERLLSASGPTAGQILKPSDGTPVKNVAFIQCAGSRDLRHKPYCSKVCCMVASKQAILFKHRVNEGQAYLFYIDLRHSGRDYEEFLVRTQQSGAAMIRGKVASVSPGLDEYGEQKLLVCAEDTLSGEFLRVPVDMVVLSTPLVPSQNIRELANTLKISLTGHGFLAEAHAKLRPVESMTPGFFLSGAAHGPKDIPESVAQASAAAGKVLGLLGKSSVVMDPAIAFVNDMCVGCGLCLEICSTQARIFSDSGSVEVIPALCQGCGMCAPACPVGAADMLNFRDDQLTAMVTAALQGK